jgi:hypothetical protein
VAGTECWLSKARDVNNDVVYCRCNVDSISSQTNEDDVIIDQKFCKQFKTSLDPWTHARCSRHRSEEGCCCASIRTTTG